MALDHVVKQGEHLTQIAQRYGFEAESLWSHPDNAKLKKLRGNPNVLLPGDVVRIPDRRPKEEQRATGQSYRFKMGGPKLMLRLALRDFGNEPLANAPCQITIDGVTTSVKTDGSGRLEVPITPNVAAATLTFTDPSVPFDLTVPIKIGHLDPVDEVSGQRARLSNLGYITRPLEEVDASYFEHVVQEFQCDAGLPLTGTCDAKTRSKLKELHGS